MKRSLWTFSVVGGQAFSLSVPGNPSVEHDGRLSLWHLVLSAKDAAEVEALVEGQHGCRIAAYTDGASAQQREERRRFLAVQTGEIVFPCKECTTCFWLDILSEELCGLDAWDSSAVDEAMRSNDKARKDAESCPAR